MMGLAVAASRWRQRNSWPRVAPLKPAGARRGDGDGGRSTEVDTHASK